VLRALEPRVREEEVRERLKELYLDLGEALEKWIG
jgi:hypothetical protein